MLLAENNQDYLKNRGYSEHAPRAIARIYLQQLLARYCQEMGLVEDITHLVLTVPEIWVREGQHAARETLQQICDELGLSHKVRLVSEPVAAAVYFAHCYQQKEQRTYQGHLLICDYGGGTLDLSLCHVQDRAVTILEGTGRGEVGQTLGAAGVAFDEAVLQKVQQRYSNEHSPRHFYRALKEFEEQKIAQTEKISKALERYYRNAATNKKIFEVGDMSIEAADLASVFDTLIKPELDKALQEMQSYLEQHQVNYQESEQFHVVLVGGFSNFYLTRQTVRHFFASRTEADQRFHSYFDLTDTALAIAKGAALIANESFKVTLTCPISVGIKARNRYLEEVDLLLLEKGKELAIYEKPHYTAMWLKVMSEAALDTTALTLFLDVANGRRRYIDLRGHLRDFIPNPHADNQWRIGFAVNDNLLFTLHVTDQSGETKITPLGNLEEKMSGLHYSEMDL
ncbi:Hsp70 family protein [Thioflexithrix psekupsensis]|uniref:Molecular chaperone n=1 Tax=Thioflexithrix psekupsensis TaxID=1570016 RepID=A0A251X890_9GAMM|nr:Hsp70 family protein [Thioflexithrix psekupsensis]OUD14269.1 hypothetical protein TPSD3_08050 [Thioflexithrix psekupsensis]